MAYVMVVDDEELIRTLVVRWLKKWGHDTVAAASADEALEQMRIRPAEIVIADIMMPVHDGIWLLDQLRRHWPDTVVIMESGAEDMTTIIRTRKHGAIDYVPKPIGREMLYQALERARSLAS